MKSASRNARAPSSEEEAVPLILNTTGIQTVGRPCAQWFLTPTPAAVIDFRSERRSARNAADDDAPANIANDDLTAPGVFPSHNQRLHSPEIFDQFVPGSRCRTAANLIDKHPPVKLTPGDL